MAADKLEQLRARLRAYGSCVVAYSGGVDSVLLAAVAHEVLGDKSLAVIADSPSLPRRELAEALAVAAQRGFPVRVVQSREFANPDYLANSSARCYFCKHHLFGLLTQLARAEGFAAVVCGENASDVGDFRPGTQAAQEFQVHAPLQEVGLTKPEIRALSAQLGLPTAAKPQMACLSSRIPYGESLTVEKLRMVEAAESALRDWGFFEVRVRHHELPPHDSASTPGQGQPSPAVFSGPANRGFQAIRVRHLARIEIGMAEMPKLLQNGLALRVAEALKKIGYAHVTLDLQGYRRGSANEALDLAAEALTDRLDGGKSKAPSRGEV